MLATDGELVLTGERTLPGIAVENYWFRRHEAAYLAVAPFTVGAALLEAGCGEGYGAERLARTSGRVIGLDYDAATVGHVARRYPAVRAIRGDLQRLPLADAHTEAVVSLQVIEHLWDQPGFITECARVLRPAGVLVLSTPNRITFSPGTGPDDRPLNPFHTRELSAADLRALVAPHFVVTRLLGVWHGRRIRRFEKRHGSIVAAQIAGPPETWPMPLRRFVPTLRADDFTVTADAPRLPIDTALDLLVVVSKRTAADPR